MCRNNKKIIINNFARGATINYYIWPITLLEFKYIITSARNVAAVAKGMVELRSTVFYSREARGRWRKVRGA